MRHRKRGRKLNRTASHRKALLRNLVVSLFEHERITTTITKAKEAAPVAEKMITLAKRGTLADRRRAMAFLQGSSRGRKKGYEEDRLDRWIVRKLFDDIGPRYSDRPGGYTRVMRISEWRLGDGAQKAVLELVGGSIEDSGKAAPTVAPTTSEESAPSDTSDTPDEQADDK